MEVRLDKRYPLDVDTARAWAVLRDIKAVAGCMPGASITEQIDDTHYKGNVKVKIGPASAAFGGDIELLGLDEATRTLRMLGKGADRSGSSASMELTASIEPGETAASSVLAGQAAVIVNGKFAQFGGRMMGQVSDMLLAQFADNFRAVAAAVPASNDAAGEPGLPPSNDAATATALPSSNGAAASTATLPPSPDAAAATSGASPATVRAPAPAPAPAVAKEINGLALIWGLIKSWFASLLGKRT
ncbi:MAG: SRPBCC family protein [Burkholderiales bacterium]|nr:SRPBCC family protein [Burkholderiales bacterium]